jgi:hypothetical protein
MRRKNNMKKTKTNDMCRVFLLCKNKATTTIPHPILREVKACQRCAEKIQKLDKNEEVK